MLEGSVLEEIVWLLIYSALGLSCFLLARKVRRLRREWKDLQEEMREKEDREDRS